MGNKWLFEALRNLDGKGRDRPCHATAFEEQLMYHRFQLILATSIVVTCMGSASGALLFYDSFNYDTSVGNSLSVAGAANWAKNQSSPDPTVQDGGGLTYPNLQVNTTGVASTKVQARRLPPMGIRSVAKESRRAASTTRF
jgi:hypothetical protein